MIFICGVLLGFGRTFYFCEELRQWKKLQQFLQMIIEELHHNVRTSGEILDKTANFFGDFDFIKNYSNANGSVQERTKIASNNICDEEMKEILMRFSDRFGCTSSEVQSETISTLLKEVELIYQNKKEKYDKDSKLSLNISVLISAGIAIFLI